ncbi:MAG TPA: hypothetical protein VH857_11745 [Actinomycetes bacterium]|nr:hypothetical protein [Actinomycetes bacterium]
MVSALAAVGVPDADCWLHPSVEVRDSPIEGHGLFVTSGYAPAPSSRGSAAGWSTPR